MQAGSDQPAVVQQEGIGDPQRRFTGVGFGPQVTGLLGPSQDLHPATLAGAERAAPQQRGDLYAGTVRLDVAWVDPDTAFTALFADDPLAFWLDRSGAVTDRRTRMGSGRHEQVDGAELMDLLGAPLPPSDLVLALEYEALAGSGRGCHLITPALLLTFDHDARTLRIDGDRAAEAATALAGATTPTPVLDPPIRTARWLTTDAEYRRRILDCQQQIRAGEAYVLCPTTAAEVLGDIDPVATFRWLRRHNPSPLAALLRLGGRSLVGSSPEQFLRRDPGSELLRTMPIKGTRRRHRDPVVDAALARELVTSPKERAENLMVVDLMRNDLSRVSRTGTVAVEELFALHRHRHVHQLVSVVAGRLRPEVGIGAVLAATFPAGSMTGTPRQRAIDLLASMEGRPRGLYSGCHGWLGADGTIDLAMTIRGIELSPDRGIVGAGGGVTIDSDPEAEVAEVHLKAAALLAALGVD